MNDKTRIDKAIKFAIKNKPHIEYVDLKHSGWKEWWFILGKTDACRSLFIVFILWENRIRVISARDMNKKEKRMYNEQA